MSLYPQTLIGVRVADDETIAALRISSGGAGFVLGNDSDGQQIVVQLFGPDPVDYALIGGLALRQLVVFRALALGARVFVQTQRPDTWASFVRIAAGTRGELQCVTSVGTMPTGSPRRPILILVDSDDSVSGGVTAAGPWCAVIAASDHATQWNVDEFTRVDVVFAQSPSVGSARVLATALALPGDGRHLVGMESDEVAVIGPGTATRVRLSTTEVERWLMQARGPAPTALPD